jgi:hypothetical protein
MIDLLSSCLLVLLPYSSNSAILHQSMIDPRSNGHDEESSTCQRQIYYTSSLQQLFTISHGMEGIGLAPMAAILALVSPFTTSHTAANLLTSASNSGLFTEQVCRSVKEYLIPHWRKLLQTEILRRRHRAY